MKPTQPQIYEMRRHLKTITPKEQGDSYDGGGGEARLQFFKTSLSFKSWFDEITAIWKTINR